MKAMIITRFGGPEVFELADVAVPVPGDYDLLVEVHACGINPVDYKIRRKSAWARTFPLILGYDVAGVVKQVGSKVERFKVGDEVYALASLIRDGGNAEYCCIDSRNTALKPKELSFIQTAALPVAVLTAWESLHKRATIHRGETVFIQAGAGGVGHFEIQFAKLQGCRVITTAGRPESIAFCKSLGADVIINHTTENVVERVLAETGGKGAEVTLDNVGGVAFEQCLDTICMHGRVVTIVGSSCPVISEKLFRKNGTLHYEFVGAPGITGLNLDGQAQTLRTINELIEAGKLRPHVSKIISLEEIPDAHRAQETGRTIGKVVVKIK